MSEPFIAEIRIFGFNFAPRGWAFCNGQLLPIAQNTALFSLIGTIYGGDGRSTTALPDLQGRAPQHPGRGPGLSEVRLGQKTGTSTVTLTPNELPQHNHTLNGVNDSGIQATPVGGVPARGNFYASSLNAAPMAPLANTGGGQAHNNLQPYLALNFCIALTGLYPSRS